MHCKGCDAPKTKEKWSYLEEGNKGSLPDHIDDNLCGDCWYAAKQAYLGLYTKTSEVIELECRAYFHKEFATLVDPVAQLLEGSIDYLTTGFFG